MAEATYEQVSKKAQDLFNKGMGAFERANLDYAVDLLTTCVELEPGFLRARKFLRAAQIRRFKEKGGGKLSHLLSTVTGFPSYCRVLGLVKSKKGSDAVIAGEKLLAKDPLNVRFIGVFADAAGAAGLPETAVQTLEIARDHHPLDPRVLKQLGTFYQQTGATGEARACFEKLCEITPNDPAAVKALKDAMALDSMQSDGWERTAEQKGTFREIIRDTKEAEVLEQQAKAVKSDKDVDSLIADTLEKLEGEPDNVNYYRSLARLYVQKGVFDSAVDVLQQALQRNPGDPELEKAISAVRIQEMDGQVKDLEEKGDEAGAAEARERREAFVYEDMDARVKRYPNDLRLRYDWGALLFERGMLNEAIQQFQLSQRSPNHRVRSLFHLAMCFKEKKQYDLARAQLEQAASELTQMDGTKKDILYELGLVAEATGDGALAADYYKQIYQVDIGYRDVAQKIEQAYDQG